MSNFESLQGYPIEMEHTFHHKVDNLDFSIVMYRLPEGAYKVLHMRGKPGRMGDGKVYDFTTLDEALTYFCQQMDGVKGEGFIEMGGKVTDTYKKSMTVVLQENHLRSGIIDCELRLYEEGSDYVLDVRYGMMGQFKPWEVLLRGRNREKAFHAYSVLLGKKAMEDYLDVSGGVAPVVSDEEKQFGADLLKAFDGEEPKVPVRKIRWRE
jgi:hypothetical protein